MNSATTKSSEADVRFAGYLKTRKAEVEEKLWALAPAESGYSAPLAQAIRYPLEAGGKRIRPILVLIGADFCRGISGEAAYAGESWQGLDDVHRSAILTAACAIEMIHTYSLVHDDLPCMDDDDLRRGRPTTHKVFGDGMAVLSGDALLTLGFELLADLPDTFAREAFLAMRELATASGHRGMVVGQAVDLEYENKPGNEEVLEYIHHNKTSALIRASLLMGARMAGATEDDYALLAEVGTSLGLIFQVVDDILDVIGDTEALGKQAGADEKLGKLTYPALIGLDASRRKVDTLKDDILSRLQPHGPRGEILVDMTHALVFRNT